MIKEALRGGATLMEKIMTNEEAQFLNDIERRLAELEEAQLLHEQEIYDARAEFDDLAAAMGWSKRDLVNGIGPMDYARNLKARAEAAEARLRELDKQEPVGYTYNRGIHCEIVAVDLNDECPCGVDLFTRPAPAINLAELVPVSIQPEYEVIKRILPTANPDEYACCVGADMWNACRAAMLRNIEEQAQ